MDNEVYGTAKNLNKMKEIIADFYCDSVDSIILKPESENTWSIEKKSGTEIDLMKVRKRDNRFYFEG